MSQKPKGIAARAGRWSAQHRKTAIFGWLAVVIAAFLLGGPFGTGTKTTEQQATGDSGRAQTISDDAFPESTTGASETVLIQSKTLKANDPEYRAVVRDLEKRMDALPEANKLASPYQQGGKGLISPDKHSVQVSFEVPGTAAQTEDARRRHARRHQGGAEGPSGLPHRPVRLRQLREGADGGVRGRPPQGRDALAPGHAADPARRVRRPRGRRPSAPARPHRRHGHDGHRRTPQPAVAGLELHEQRHPPDRPRGRRGLLAVLHPARA